MKGAALEPHLQAGRLQGVRRLLRRQLPWALHRRSAWQLAVEAARRAMHWGVLALHRLLRDRYFEKRIYDYRMLLDGADPGICSQLIRRGERELEQRYILQRELKAGMTVFDLGANIGYYTIMMARQVGPEGRIYAVEPDPANYALLNLNILRNQLTRQAILQQIAIGESDGEQLLWASDHSNWHSLHKPQIDSASPWRQKYQRRIVGARRVKTLSLASYLNDKPAVDLLRMDIEGYEVQILAGLLQLPAGRQQPRILFETHPEFYDRSTNDLRPVLQDLCGRRGYYVKYLVSDYQQGSRTNAAMAPGRDVFLGRGYGAGSIVREFRNRAIYQGVNTVDAIDLICDSEYVNSAYLAPQGL